MVQDREVLFGVERQWTSGLNKMPVISWLASKKGLLYGVSSGVHRFKKKRQEGDMKQVPYREPSLFVYL